LILFDEAQKQVFGADVVMVEALSLFLSHGQHFTGSLGEAI
jgi:hypothetical protein